MSATLLASTTIASLGFADDTTSPPPAAGGATTPSGSASDSSASDSTTIAPTAPGAPATSTTTTTQGTTTVNPPTPSSPTATTTITSAEEVMPMTPTVPMTSTRIEPSRDMTLYSKRTPNKPLLLTGGALLIGTYATTAGLAAVNGPTSDKDLYIPVVGPWVNLVNREDTGKSTETRDVILIAGSGVLQGIGAAMALTSLFIPEKVPTARITAGPVKMNITPTAGPGAGGLGAFGTF